MYVENLTYSQIDALRQRAIVEQNYLDTAICELAASQRRSNTLNHLKESERMHVALMSVEQAQKHCLALVNGETVKPRTGLLRKVVCWWLAPWF